LSVGKQWWRSPETWLFSLSECRGQQEAMLLMTIGGWFGTDLGRFVLESSLMRCVPARLVLHAGE